MIAMIPFVQSYLVSSFCEEVRLTCLGIDGELVGAIVLCRL